MKIKIITNNLNRQPIKLKYTMKTLFIFCVIIASQVHADIYKCPMAGGKVAYQSQPCKSGEGQNVIKSKKSEAESTFDAILARDEAGSSAAVKKLQAYTAYAKEFGAEAQPFTDVLTDDIKVINDASKGLSIVDEHNPTYVFRLKSIHEEMKQKNIPSLSAYYDYKEKEVLKQQSIDKQNQLQEEANRIARQQLIQQSIDTSRNKIDTDINERQRKIDSDRQSEMLEESNRLARETLEIEQRRLRDERIRY